MIAAAHTLLLQLEVPLESVQGKRPVWLVPTAPGWCSTPPRRARSGICWRWWTSSPQPDRGRAADRRQVTDEASAREAAAPASTRWASVGVMITLGSQRGLLQQGAATGAHAGFRVKAVDTTAAGDTFNGAPPGG